MDTKEFCYTMNAELAGWRSRMYDIINHVQMLPALDRPYFESDMSVLRSVIGEREDSLRDIARVCPADFRAGTRGATGTS